MTSKIWSIASQGVLKREFSLHGLLIDEQNFPKSILSLNDRQKVLRKFTAEIQDKQIESETEVENFFIMNTFDVKLEEVDLHPSQPKKSALPKRKRQLPSFEGCYSRKYYNTEKYDNRLSLDVQHKTTFCNSCRACKSEKGRTNAIKQKENAVARRAEDAADYYFLNIIDQEKEAVKEQAKKEKDEKRQQRRENREKRINEMNLKESETVSSQSEWAPGTLGK